MLARELVSWLHSAQAAELAEAEFDRVFLAKDVPEQIGELELAGELGGDPVHMPGRDRRRFRHVPLGGPHARGRRRSARRGALGEGEQDLPAGRLDGAVLQVGKRRFVRLRAG